MHPPPAAIADGSTPRRCRARRTAIGLAAAALLTLIAGVFYPIIGFEFVRLDVGGHLLENPDVQGLRWENVQRIFTSFCTTSYYPVRSLSFAVDYQLWGLNPAGFELTNGLLHATSVLLLFWLLLRLAVPTTWRGIFPAALATAVFAIHPLVVEPVAWLSGREELLMMLWTLGCVHFHLTARRLADRGAKTRWVFAAHALAALCCGAACLSNAVAAVIPLLIVALDLLTLARPATWRILAGTAALWPLAAATIALKSIAEYHNPSTGVFTPDADRLPLIFSAYHLNLKSIFCPKDLSSYYPPLAPAGFSDPQVLLGMTAAALTLALLWTLRRRKLLLLGLLWFLIALAPTAQIMGHHIHRADRFLYLPLVGLAVALAAALRLIAGSLPRRAALPLTATTAALLLLPLVRLSVAQVATWRNTAAMWENCVRVSPSHFPFRVAYAESLASAGQFEPAVQQYELVLQSAPEHAKAMIRLAWLLVAAPNQRLRDPHRALRLAEQALAQNPLFFRAAADIRTRVSAVQAAAGQFASAIDGYRWALQVDPANQRATLELAWMLATCRDQTLRDPQEAVRLAERDSLLSRTRAAAQPGSADPPSSAEAADDAQRLEELRRRLRAWIDQPGGEHGD